MHREKFFVIVVFVVIVTTLFSLSAGGFFSYGMMVNDGGMQGCPYMEVAAICTMNVFEHMAAWRSLFAATPQQLPLIALLLLVSFGLSRWIARFLLERTYGDAGFQFRLHPSLGETVPNALQLALSRGVIHSKAF